MIKNAVFSEEIPSTGFTDPPASTTSNNNTDTCVACSRINPFCPDCTQDKVCKSTPTTCQQCATAECVSPDKCVLCTKEMPACTLNCVRGEKCVIAEQSCGQCAHPICVPEETSECVMCAMAIPECPKCAAGKKCVMKKQTCSTCAQAACQ